MTALCQQFFIVDPVQDDVQTVVQIEEERGGPAEAVEEARCSPGLLGVFREPGDVGEDVADADDEMVLLARDISKQIESELKYPGQIKVNVIRESRVTDYAK